MIYVTSDLHGCPVDELKKLLSSVGFSGEDLLYVLGDAIDRGNHGIELLRFMMESDNIEFILGNHEQMMLACSFLFEKITDDSIDKVGQAQLSSLSGWMMNGAEPTISALKSLMRSSPETVWDIIDYISDAPLYAAVSAGGRDFVLVHSGLGNFSYEKKLSDYTEEELLWSRPTFDDRYFEDAITVFGHTPTGLFSPEYKGRLLRTDTWIDIDTGRPPVLLRLDDLKEFSL